MTSPIIFIDGDQGTTGLQIHAHLDGRPDLHLLTLPETRRKDPAARAEALNACDIAILCLPDDAAREAVSFITAPHVRVIDASSAHRTCTGWVYGFPEMATEQAARIAQATRVSNPGCYPTGAIGLLRPLREAGLLSADHPLSIHAVSGYSGGGRPAVEAFEGTSGGQPPGLRLYGLQLAHKHPPEIRHYCGLSRLPLFVPAYAAYRQGIVLSIPLHRDLLPAVSDAARLHDCLATHYANAGAVAHGRPPAVPSRSAGLQWQQPHATGGLRKCRCRPDPAHGRVRQPRQGSRQRSRAEPATDAGWRCFLGAGGP
ncbi:N-acetyl-gamma-glutamyl-phosphate reductase [Candidatus Dactylopiibacterium carminicum]|uniref:N-acetyl-gamma-glutamyl-phosphate reductase n=1 Tax=Candidatus Dactylopiibacterium carminicum TaxID=857335 RepID=UPI001CC29350|nr:N-acetyl-gamma-glutamyl-phosphate reductase [Candidatus Dactylopiibacterium carminicum]